MQGRAKVRGNSSDALVAREDPALAARVTSVVPLAGVTAGSALLRVGDWLIAVHDDAFRVSLIALPDLFVTPVVLDGDGAPLPKSAKPDFECAVRGPDGAIHVLGSGSTPNRCTHARIDLDARQVALVSRPRLYDSVANALGLGSRPNIEGVVIDGGNLRLFHRGAGEQPSAIVDLPIAALTDLAALAPLRVRTFDLGALDGVTLGFTDAAVAAGRTLFVAAAEDTADAIADGAVSGSVFGVLEPDSARWTRIVAADGSPWRFKVEGLTVDRDFRAAWILTDADDASIPTMLGRVELVGF